jgi:hypothetical protein
LIGVKPNFRALLPKLRRDVDLDHRLPHRRYGGDSAGGSGLSSRQFAIGNIRKIASDKQKNGSRIYCFTAALAGQGLDAVVHLVFLRPAFSVC